METHFRSGFILQDLAVHYFFFFFFFFLQSERDEKQLKPELREGEKGRWGEGQGKNVLNIWNIVFLMIIAIGGAVAGHGSFFSPLGLFALLSFLFFLSPPLSSSLFSLLSSLFSLLSPLSSLLSFFLLSSLFYYDDK